MGSQWEAFNCNKLANQRKRLYVKEYTPECEFVTLRGFEIPIQLPVKPKDKDIINYGLPPGKQKFKREVLKSEREWRIMTEEEKIAYGEE